jgi:heat shock protein HtpX
MTATRDRPLRWYARLPPAVLLVVAGAMVVGWLRAWSLDQGADRLAPWWAYLFLVVMSVALLSLAAAVTIDPRSLVLRRALAGTALAWTAILAGVIVGLERSGADAPVAALVVMGMISVAVALGGLGLTTDAVAGGAPTDWAARFGIVLVFAIAIVISAGVVVGIASIARDVGRSLNAGHGLERLPWALVVAIVLLPVVSFALASIGTRNAAGGTFWAQAAANRRNSLLLAISLVGILAATAEIIAASLTFQAAPALWTALAAAGLGLLIAAIGNRAGAWIILETAGARRADPRADAVLLDVVRELSLAANIPTPAVYVIADGSQNAFATGRDPEHASLAVTSGLVQRMDREELQGVVGHELGHIRNLDTRYALNVAILVGLVALVTDGFLRMVVEGWRNGAFFWRSDDKSAAASLAMGLFVGLFLLIVAVLLRVVAPLFAALVQASTSREREFLADATSVELTRNPRGLERALSSIAADTDTLEAANRGTQHLWFRNPVKPGSDRRSGWLSTHPSLGARIDRLRVLEGLDPLGASAPTGAET